MRLPSKGNTCVAVLGWSLVAALSWAGEAADDASLQATPEQMQWWRDAKFGLFIHWGPVSLKGTEIGWSRGGERRGRSGKGQIPVEEYDSLYKRFNPVKFNAREWVEIAKAAGMKYMVFTSKHHDGFSMFDSKLTDYKITNSPFKRDVVGELAKACQEGGLKVGWYYSPVDWYHPDYRTERHARYIEFLHGQLRELCTNYGKIDIIWFDGLGGSARDWNSVPLVRMIRQLQPGVIINNRAGLPCDHDTPEQRVGRFNNERAWESCITICRQWAWKPDDTMKTLKQCIDILVRTVGGDGNLLFNVGPMPTGEIEPRQVARLKEMGAWLAKNGESIYGTRGGPFRPGSWGASTYKGDTIYVHILNKESAKDGLQLPGIKKRIVSASLLGGGAVSVTGGDESTHIKVPAESLQDLDTVVVLKLDGPAAEVEVVGMTSGSAARGKKARASNVYRKNQAYGPDKAFDDDEGTRWATDSGVKEAWLEVDLGKPTAFERAFLSEEYGRARSFELQYKDGDEWRTFAKGKRIGENRVIKFNPVTARVVRLNILDATDGPTICEFQLFPTK